MNEGFTPNHPSDEDPDPLLAALRQRLGGYGQEPPPELWAGIRQRLPAAAPRPWWLRARRLLPLLAGLLLVSMVLVQPIRRALLAGRPVGSAPASQLPPAASPPLAPNAQPPANAASGRVAPASWPGATGLAARKAAATGQPGSGPTGKAPASGLAAAQPEQGEHQRNNRRFYPAATTVFSTRAAKLPAAEFRRASGPLALARRSRHRSMASQPLADNLAALSSPSGTRAARRATAWPPAAAASRATRALAGAAGTGRQAANRRHRAALAQPVAAGAHGRYRPAELATGYAITSRGRRRLLAPGNAGSSVAFEQLPLAHGVAALGLGADTLAPHQVGLLLPARPLPAPLAARPDSFAPHLAPVRRWAVLAVAGSTLSYRTLPANTNSLTYSSSPITNSPSASGSTRASTSYTDLEQPAAGLGAQVQVRRVLSGRWALALGLGYQEYATRISTSGSGPLVYTSSPNNSYTIDSTKVTGTLRDTYRLLTLPVQLSYALGPPHGRLALGLLGGFEPGWYLGGQSAEASSCHCQQQSFTSASASPYNTFTLGINLGLDVRLRLGAPASRWQLVLQPTGRYVATSFVRSTSIYARRQPYSLGILAGVAWAFQ